MTKTYKYYMILLISCSLILTAIVLMNPAINQWAVPSFVLLFIPSLAFDLISLPKIQNGEIPPLNAMDRGLGMCLAALLHIMLIKFLI